VTRGWLVAGAFALVALAARLAGGRRRGELPISYRQARYFRPANRTSIDRIVIHSAETDELPSTAELLGEYVATLEDPKVSWHYAVDVNTIVQSVKEHDIAYGARGANDEGIHIELAGRASQSAAQWLDPYSRAMLELAAELVAQIARRWNVPVRFVDAGGLERAERGITTHAEVTLGPGRGLTDHTDPGPNFPMVWFVERVRSYG
jgi:N-acetyl-anhydromuramyl-L-alanine amidase AmpD